MAELGDTAAVALEDAVFELLRQRLTKTILVPAPAAGAEWSVAVPAGAFWVVQSARARLVTSAVVANRNVRVIGTDGTTEVGRIAAAVAQPASIDAVHSFGPEDAPDYAGAGGLTFNHPLPVARLVAGGVLSSLTQNLDVGDQWSGIALQVEEWSLTSAVQAAEWYGRKQWPT